MLTPGEFVVSAPAVQEYGTNTLESMNAMGGGTNKPEFKEPKVEIKEQDFLERAEEEKKELEESYRESLRQANERKFNDG